MKTLIATVALAAIIASPALAQTASRRAQVQQDAAQFDPSAGRNDAQRRAINSGIAVYEGNQYLGADPDPNVRLNLRMDYEHRDF